MDSLKLDFSRAASFIAADALSQQIQKAGELCAGLFEDRAMDADAKGWLHCDKAAEQVGGIMEKAAEIRAEADVFVLVGVGGSNQAARAMIEALSDGGKPEIVYAGNTLSSHSIRQILRKMEGRNVYINVIAKNFETLEPGSHFRILRHAMGERYSGKELAKRVILTGTRGQRLEEIAKENGYAFLPFPEDVGGRYSAFSPVGLLPIAVAGLDVAAFLDGARAMETEISQSPRDNIAVRYACVRNLLYRQGFHTELLASFEPRLAYFAKWWIQLFGESEGKGGQGIFPAAATYSEDLHSMGQYLQDGRRDLIETFLLVRDPGEGVTVPPDKAFGDGFDYLDGMDFTDINRAAQVATLAAHSDGGVPCVTLEAPAIHEAAFGMMFYFFMVACAVSGKLSGVNPFDQEGVEEYKRSMFTALGKA